MKTERSNKIRFIFGSAIILMAVLILYNALNNGPSDHAWANFMILTLLGVSWFLPPVKEMSLWLFLRILVIMVMAFTAGYIWR
jgi:hypothetical protein